MRISRSRFSRLPAVIPLLVAIVALIMDARHHVYYLAPLGLALARPLPRIPRPVPRAVTPLAAPRLSDPPRLLSPDAGRLVVAGVTNFDADFDGGGFSTKDVSVVLQGFCEKNRSFLSRLYIQEGGLAIK